MMENGFAPIKGKGNKNSPLVAMGGDWWSRDREFEYQHWIQNSKNSHKFALHLYWFLKRGKRWQGWPSATCTQQLVVRCGETRAKYLLDKKSAAKGLAYLPVITRIVVLI